MQAIETILPCSITSSGATCLTFKGKNLETIHAIKFNQENATCFTIVSNNEIIAWTPFKLDSRNIPVTLINKNGMTTTHHGLLNVIQTTDDVCLDYKRESNTMFENQSAYYLKQVPVKLYAYTYENYHWLTEYIKCPINSGLSLNTCQEVTRILNFPGVLHTIIIQYLNVPGCPLVQILNTT